MTDTSHIEAVLSRVREELEGLTGQLDYYKTHCRCGLDPVEHDVPRPEGKVIHVDFSRGGAAS